MTRVQVRDKETKDKRLEAPRLLSLALSSFKMQNPSRADGASARENSIPPHDNATPTPAEEASPREDGPPARDDVKASRADAIPSRADVHVAAIEASVLAQKSSHPQNFLQLPLKILSDLPKYLNCRLDEAR